MMPEREPKGQFRRRLAQRHVLEWILIVIALLMIGASLFFLFSAERNLMILRGIAVLGVLLNFGLSVRCLMTRTYWAAIGFALISAACAGGMEMLVHY